VRSNLSCINVYKKKSVRSEVVTQLLYGDTFKKIKKKGTWIKIKNDKDNYQGFIKVGKFPQNQINSHKIYKIFAELYSQPNKKNKIKKKLSFASEIKVLKKQGQFCKFDNWWIKKKDLKRKNYNTRDIFKKIKNFVNIRYKWGGKYYNGIDCSGLIQLCFNFNNKFCPRDAKDQIKYFKKKIKLKNIRKNDLIFWKGHVAVAISKEKLIHAYGPHKKVVIMPIKKTINLIKKTAKLNIIGIRRVA